MNEKEKLLQELLEDHLEYEAMRKEVNDLTYEEFFRLRYEKSVEDAMVEDAKACGERICDAFFAMMIGELQGFSELIDLKYRDVERSDELMEKIQKALTETLNERIGSIDRILAAYGGNA